MRWLSEHIITLIRHNPGTFFLVCAGVAVILLIVSNPAILFRLLYWVSVLFTGIFILVRNIAALLTAVESFILGLFKSTFEQLQRLLK